MRNSFLRAVAFSWLALVVLFPGRTRAADAIRVLCSNGIKPVVEELVPEFERNTSHKINITYGVSTSLARQIANGEPFDVAILTESLIDEAVESLRIQRGSVAELARSPMALGIKQGRPKPAIGSVDGLKSALRGAGSIAYAREGASAPFFAQATRKLGLADELAPKIRLTENGAQAAAMVARGDADLCVLPTSEILPVPGLDVLGSFPDDMKGYLVMVGGVGARAREPDAAGSFIRFLQSPAAVPVLRKKGMEKE